MLFQKYPRETLTVLGLTAGGSLTFYIYTTYMQKFLTNTGTFTRDQATELSAATLVCFMLAQPLLGWISDKVGRKPLLLMAFGGGALITWPVLTTVAASSSVVAVFFILLGAMLVQGGYTADQWRGEGRTLSRPCAHPGRGAALCAGQCHLRRHGGICGAVVQVHRRGARLLYLRLGDPGVRVPGGADHARYPPAQPDSGGLAFVYVSGAFVLESPVGLV